MTTARKQEADGFPVVDLGQKHIQAFLESCLRDRVPALLFTGPPGCGKELTAIDFARRLCCTRDPKCELGGTLCDSCRAALALEHQGIHMIYPTPTQGGGEKEGDDEPDIGKVLVEKRRDIFDTYRFPKKVSIRIARARAIIKRANTKPFGSPYNVFVIIDAHTMREEAQNALLKVVEEPPQSAALIFVTSNPDAILYTIRSRCQRLRFHPLEDHVVESVLVGYYGIDTKVAKRASQLAQGSIQRASEIASDYDAEERASVYAILEGIRTAPESWVVRKAMRIARGANRDGVARFLHELAVAYRDVMTGDESLFVNKDQAKLLREQTGHWDRRTLPAIVSRITDTRDGVLRRNLNMDGALVQLFLDIKRLG